MKNRFDIVLGDKETHALDENTSNLPEIQGDAPYLDENTSNLPEIQEGHLTLYLPLETRYDLTSTYSVTYRETLNLVPTTQVLDVIEITEENCRYRIHTRDPHNLSLYDIVKIEAGLWEGCCRVIGIPDPCEVVVLCLINTFGLTPINLESAAHEIAERHQMWRMMSGRINKARSITLPLLFNKERGAQITIRIDFNGTPTRDPIVRHGSLVKEHQVMTITNSLSDFDIYHGE